mmetsp:Transcript_9640/g.14520  ORF Transcript_9640/g.14520 Transcript_9640/m.14520 type:complete len:84 (+) Transcript_9640:56-307(+)
MGKRKRNDNEKQGEREKRQKTLNFNPSPSPSSCVATTTTQTDNNLISQSNLSCTKVASRYEKVNAYLRYLHDLRAQRASKVEN